MRADDSLRELQALDAVASERGMVLAFLVCEDSGDLEPVFLRVHRARSGEESEAALITIDDGRGMSLGRFVVNRDRLDLALAEAEDVESERGAEAGVPLEWQQTL
jgi:hypothetical protein